MSTTLRQCPHCGTKSRRINCCGVILAERRRWRMTKAMVRHIQIFARARKGLDDDSYRANLTAVGADSTTKLTRAQHHELMLRLGRYPDSPKWQTRREVRAQRGRVSV